MGKINIHLTLDIATIKHVRAINQGIRAVTPSLIAFDASSPCIPHITLASGHLKDGLSLEALCKPVAAVAELFARRVVPLSQPYISSDGSFVFSDVLGEAIADLKTHCSRALDEWLDDNKAAARTAHLTLGYIERDAGRVTEFLQTIQNFDARCDAIAMSDSGLRGTCINSLFVCALAGRDA